MRTRFLPKVAIIVLALSVGMMLLSGQATHAAAYPYYYGNPYNGCNYYNGYYYGAYGSPYYCYNCPYYYYGNNPYYYYNNYPYYYCSYGYAYTPPSPTPASYQLTVSTDPASLGTATGSGTFTSGSTASFSVTNTIIQSSANTRYVFSHWSGNFSGVGTSGSVTVNGPMSIVADYQLQYLLNVAAQPAGAPTAQGGGWYNAGDTATLSAGSQIIPAGDQNRLVFQGWSVDGQTAQPGVTLALKMDGPHTATAQYKQQYYLTVTTDQGVAYGEGWYDAGSTAQIYVSTPASTSYGVSYVFNGWQGDIQSSSQSASVLMDKPKMVIGSWRTDSTVLDWTIALGIIGVFLIAVAILVFAVLSRRGSQVQPVYYGTPPAPQQQLQPAPTPPTSTTTTTPQRRRVARKKETETEQDTSATEQPPAEQTPATGSTQPPA
jgi:hypothetical protein